MDLKSCQPDTVVLASLVTLGNSPQSFADGWNIDLVSIASQPNSIWEPDTCPMCAEGVPLVSCRPDDNDELAKQKQQPTGDSPL